MPQSAGHLIVKTLQEHGVRRVYAVPGESYLDVLDGLHDAQIETVVARHEGGAGFMALAEGRLGEVPGVCMVTRGPGAANAMIAVHTAWQDATALVLFVGLIPQADRGREAFQEFSLEGWFGTTAKAVFTLDDEHQAGQLTARAMRLAASGRPGPVVIGLPEDVLVRRTSAPVPALPTPAPAVDRQEISAVCRTLAGAQRPLLVAGGDGWSAEASQNLAAFAEAAHVPVLTDWRAYDVIDHDSPAYGGWLGYGRAETAVQALQEADLLVFLGCVRGDVLSEGYTAAMDTPTIVINPDPDLKAHSGRLDTHLSVRPGDFLEALSNAQAARGNREAAWMESLRRNQLDFQAPGSDGNQGVDLAAAFDILEQRLPKDRIATYGAGNATLWGHRYLSHHGPRSLVGPRNGAMGLSVPAAVAASLMHPGRTVVAVCGDGDFFMNAQELAVCFAHGGTPLVIVVDNGIYGTIVAHQRQHYPGRPSGTSMANPNFGRWIASFGGHGELVATTEEFAPALERALDSGLPAVLHLKTDPDTMGPGTTSRGKERSA